jgi:hypothetical protein
MVTGTEVESHELKLFMDNDERIYSQQGLPIIKNLTRKKAAGIYNHEKAKKLYKYYADNGARRYGETHLGSASEGLRVFSPEVRRRVASEYADQFEADYGYGNYNEYIPKKYRKTAAERMEGLK